MRRSALVTSLYLLAAAAARADRPPLQGDLGRCALAMLNTGSASSLQGSLRLMLLVRRNGTTYASFVTSARGIDNLKLERCVAEKSLIWALNEVPIDYHRAYGPIGFAPPEGTTQSMSTGAGQGAPGVFLPHANEIPPPEPIDYELAARTLEIQEEATLAERGLADLLTHQYPAAVQNFRGALEKNAAEPLALRGLAQALAETNQLPEARETAAKLLQIAPESVAGHEAMLRVCLLQKEAPCLVQHWQAATKAKDFAPRSRIFKEELQTAVQQTVADARKGGAPQTGQAPQATQAPAADECAAAKSDEALALCMVKRCLDAGSAQYAKELGEQNKVAYTSGDWHAKAAGTGKVVVSRPISGNGEQHNPMWLVKLGDQVTMQPTNAEARQITLTHNACAARVNVGK